MRKMLTAAAVILLLLATAFSIAGPGTEALAEGAGSWSPSAVGGFEVGGDNFSAVPLVEYGGKLYAGAMNGDGAQVWRMKDDGSWESVMTGGFGDSGNLGIVRMQVFGGYLYAGTLNLDGCGLWRYDGSVWTDALASSGPGFGDAHNIGVTAMEVLNNTLYVGTLNYNYPFELFYIEGGRIWSSADGTTWSQVVGQGPYGSTTAPGFGDSLNLGITSLRAYNSALYAGTARMQLAVGIEEGGIRLTLNPRGCELWRRSGSVWTERAGGGFGDEKNAAILSMEPYMGRLHIGTTNGNLSVLVNTDTGDISELTYGSNGLGIFTYDGSALVKKLEGGFGDTADFSATSMCVADIEGASGLLVGAANADGAGKLRRYDGSSWYQAADDGFGSGDNSAVSSLAAFEGSVYAGTVNTEDGCEVWRGSPPAAPGITGISPTSGPVGTPVTINGSAFGDSQGTSCVRFNNTVAGCTEWTDTVVKAVVPAGATSGPVTVTTSVGTSNGASFTVFQPPHISGISPTAGRAGTVVTISGSDFGASGDSSNVRFNNTVATAFSGWTASSIKAQVPSGATSGPVTVTTPVGTSNGVSFTVKPAAQEPVPEPEPEPATTTPTWYLAEGTTAWGFDTYVSIENPNESSVHAEITYMTAGGPMEGGTLSLPAMSQATVNPKDALGEKDFSTKVVCTEGKTIAVDRTMSWNGASGKGDRHCSIGVTSPAKTWYLPEGSSAWGFECWLLIQNPNDKEASCRVTYMIEGEGPREFEKKIPPNSRSTFNMESDIGSKDASIKVGADVPVIPERAMYRNDRSEGHDSIGTCAPATDYYLAEGTTDWGFTTYVLVQNPNAEAASVTVTYMTSGGPEEQPAFSMPPNSRKTIRVNEALPGKDLSTRVHSDRPIIAERAMYWDSSQGEKCHDSIGMDSPHTSFYLPDGDATGSAETWTLVQNPNGSDVKILVSYLTPSGKGNKSFTDTVPANSRKTYSMADTLPGTRASVLVTSRSTGRKIVCERSMYWGEGRTAGTDTIGGY